MPKAFCAASPKARGSFFRTVDVPPLDWNLSQIQSHLIRKTIRF
jgi:hypothetical protein